MGAMNERQEEFQMMRQKWYQRLLPLLPLALLVCKSGDPTSGGLPGFSPPGGGNLNRITIALRSNNFDLEANGRETAILTATVRDANGSPMAGQRVDFTVRAVGTTGLVDDPGRLLPAFAITNAQGQATTVLRAPDLFFIPVGASIQVTATLTGQASSPSSTVTIQVIPKGTAPPGTGTGGDLPSPIISEIVPNMGPVERATQVIILGQNFDPGATVTFVSSLINPPVVVTPVQRGINRLLIQAPVVTSTQAGEATVFVTNSDGQVSNRVIFEYTSEDVDAPRVIAISPTQGPTQGGTSITISGSNFSPNDTVVIASPTIPGGELTLCSGGCDNNGPPKATRCPASSGNSAFQFIGPGQIRVITQCVGVSGSGLADLFVRNNENQVSNFVSFEFVATPTIGAPVIAEITPDSILFPSNCIDHDMSATTPPRCVGGCLASVGTEIDGYQMLLVGSNFSPCASILIFHNAVLHEFLPDRVGKHQASGVIEDCPQLDELNLVSFTGPDGNPGCTTLRPDLVPYPHTRIVNASPIGCLGISCCDDFAPAVEGKYVWLNESTIRLLFGPTEQLACGADDVTSVWVSNEPGEGLLGDSLSNEVNLTLECSNFCGG